MALRLRQPQATGATRIARSPISLRCSTVRSPLSTLTKVVLLIMALCAIVEVEILRRLRASTMSDPSFRSARFTGSGSVIEERERIMFNLVNATYYTVHYTGH